MRLCRGILPVLVLLAGAAGAGLDANTTDGAIAAEPGVPYPASGSASIAAPGDAPQALSQRGPLWKALHMPPKGQSGLYASTHRDLMEIRFREDNARLTHARAAALRAEVRALRRRFGLRKASDVDKLSADRQRQLSEAISGEEERIWHSSGSH